MQHLHDLTGESLHDVAVTTRLYIAFAGRWDGEKPEIMALAEAVGEEVARQGHVLVTGGGSGSMHAASRGAKRMGGMTIGLLPGIDRDAGPFMDVAIPTGLGFEGRSVLIIRASDALIVVGGANGSLGEVSTAYLNSKPIVVLKGSGGWADRLPDVLLDGAFLDERRNIPVVFAHTPVECVAMATALVHSRRVQVEGV